MEMEEDLKIVSDVCMVSAEQMRARDRRQHITLARHLFFFLERKQGLNNKTIGDFLGYDRVTVMHGAQKIDDYIGVKDELVWKFWTKIRDRKKMSERKQTMVIGPATGCDNNPEHFSIDGFECPYCNGHGWHRVYDEGKENSTVTCSRCHGSGQLRAHVVIKWEAEPLYGEPGISLEDLMV